METKMKGSFQLLLGLGLALIFFYMMAPFMVAMMLGAITAILWYPLYERSQRLFNKNISALFVTLTVTFGILLPLFFVIYSAVSRLSDLISQIRLPTGGIQSLLTGNSMQKLSTFVKKFTFLDDQWLETQGKELLQLFLEKSTKLITVSLSNMPGLLLGFFVVIISIFFFLRDGAQFLRFLASVSPLAPAKSKKLYDSFQASCRGVVLGIVLSALVQGSIVFLLLLISGIQNPFFLGVVSVVLGMVPVIGCAPVWVGGAIYHFMQGSVFWGVFMLIGGVVVSVSDNIVRPWVMSGKSEMHPLLALVSVFGAVNLMGATGIFLGPIIAAVFVSFLKMLSSEIQHNT
jgi:predicted PurR-regulated permease PerM